MFPSSNTSTGASQARRISENEQHRMYACAHEAGDLLEFVLEGSGVQDGAVDGEDGCGYEWTAILNARSNLASNLVADEKS